MAKNKKQNDVLISFGDIKYICKKNAYKILFGAVFCSLLATLFTLSRPIKYGADATFREKSKTLGDPSGGKSLAMSLLMGGGEGNENAAVSLMKSRNLMEELIREMNLQAIVKPKGLQFSILKDIRDNVITGWAYFIDQKTPALPEVEPEIKVIDIWYPSEVPLKAVVKFTSETAYELNTPKRVLLATGELGKPLLTKGYQFTVERHTNAPLEGKEFKLELVPLYTLADKISKEIQVFPDSLDKTLIHLFWKDRDRYQAAAFLNNLMRLYGIKLKQEQQRITDEQIGYLNRRQEEMASQLKDMMHKYADSMAMNMGDMEVMVEHQQKYVMKLIAIDLEIKRLQKAQEEGFAYYDRNGSDGDPIVLNQILSEIRSLKQQSDSIDLALRRSIQDNTQIKNSLFLEQMADLNAVRQHSIEAKELIARLEQDSPLDAQGILKVDSRYMVGTWQQKLEELRGALVNVPADGKKDVVEELNCCRENFLAYLHNLVHLLDVNENMIKERLTHQQNPQVEFQGIDLSMANQLYLNYSKSLNEIEADALQYQFILEQMKDPSFEISSLSTVLTDPVSREMVAHASNLVLQLKDKNNRSQKELDRIQEDLSLQRGFLVMHVNQTISLLQLRVKMYQEKIKGLQSITLELIQQRISILENHMKDYIEERLQNLQQEQSVIEQHQLDLQQKTAQMPEQWVAGKLIDQHLEIGKKMVEEITKLVESKNISSNIDLSQSAPVDRSIPPIHPLPPLVLAFTLIGALAGAFMTMGFVFLKNVLHGVPATQDNLKMAHQHVSGAVTKAAAQSSGTFLLDSDLETLRGVVSYVSKPTGNDKSAGAGNFLLVITGKGVDYANNLAILLSKGNHRVLVLPLSFDSPTDPADGPGLLQVFEGQAAAPRVKRENEGYDTISAGGISRYSHEWVTSKVFQEMAADFIARYDWVVLVSHVLPISSEAVSLLSMFDHAVINITDEKLPEVLNVVDQAEEDSTKSKKITFVMSPKEVGK
jgi:hypothetical protein